MFFEERNKAILEAENGAAPLKLWSDGSKLDKRAVAAVVWKKDSANVEWQEQKVGLSLNKEIFDPELWGIF